VTTQHLLTKHSSTVRTSSLSHRQTTEYTKWKEQDGTTYTQAGEIIF